MYIISAKPLQRPSFSVHACVFSKFINSSTYIANKVSTKVDTVAKNDVLDIKRNLLFN